jgi:hypothetical protein
MSSSWYRQPDGSAVCCFGCGERVGLDVARIYTDGDAPTIPCTRCGTMLPVPVFGSEGWDLDQTSTGEAPAARPSTTPDAASEPLVAPLEETTPAPARRPERRDPDRPKAAAIACRNCGTEVEINPDRMRLTVTHAVLPCPSCGAEFRARRSDAFRDLDTALGWSFYANEEDGPEPDHLRHRNGISRFFGGARS